MVIIAIIFQGSIFLHSQQNDEIISQFDKAVNAYISGQDDSSKVRLERVISNIQAKRLEVEKKDILGKCYLLMGAISEKKGETLLAEENYRKTKEYGGESIPGVDLNGLPIYKRVVKGEIDIDTPFQKAVGEYNNGQYDNSKTSLEQLIGIIKGGTLDKKGILGKCYLLLGAVYERKGEPVPAEENYHKAKESGVESIDGVDLNDLPIYRRVVKGEIDIDTPFQKAVEEYNNGQYDNSKAKLEQVIGTIKERKLDKKEILGKCYLLLGAIYEKKVETPLAEEYYRKAKGFGIKSIDCVDLDGLPTYKRVILGIIEKEIVKKKFPVLLVIAGVAVAVAAVILVRINSDDKGCTFSIAITSPSNNETVRGTVAIQAAVTGDCVVDRVEFFIDGVLKGTDTSVPYSYDWDTTTAFVGPHALRVVAYSTTGNNSSQITVTVAP